ncbi:hypothetical protein V8F33_005531 [Rhypophila sp. PSN 637]
MQFPPPPEILATWPTPNYENPESRGPSLLIIEVITLLLALLALAIRLYVKFGLLRKPRWDDYLMIMAAVSATGLTISICLANTLYKWDHHIWDLQFDDLVTARKVSLAAQLLYLLASTVAKISILLSYIALAVPDSTLHRASQVTIVFIVLSNLSIFIVILAQCKPVSSYWNIMKVNEDCHIREGHFLMAQAGMTVIMDLLVWILPLPTLYKARLPFRQRLALIVLFSFGAVVVVAACLRTYWLWWAAIISWDMTWDCFDEWIWTAVEVHLGIICGCVPWCRSLVNLLGDKKRRQKEREQIASAEGEEYALSGGKKSQTSGSKVGQGHSAGGTGVRSGHDPMDYTVGSPSTYTCTVDAEAGPGSSQWWDKEEERDSDGSDLIFQRHGSLRQN